MTLEEEESEDGEDMFEPAETWDWEAVEAEEQHEGCNK